MNGAESLVRTLVRAGVDVCFANPGTSEMHFVAALDRVPEMRGVLCLFEGVATGMADGFGRMAERPAATLLHLGTGLANGCANLHNARKAYTPIVNIVGDHTRAHLQYPSAFVSDVAAIARPFSDWVRVAESSLTLSVDAALAVAAARSPCRPTPPGTRPKPSPSRSNHPLPCRSMRRPSSALGAFSRADAK
jgi:acetolactate synthase-1/2/3 large subunit